MKRTLLGLLAFAGLLLTLVPSLFVFSGSLSPETNKSLMAAGMLLWFVVAPFWIKRSR
ncbi:MAG: hypothetical protein H6565_12090 [Lewinellaceae bacterium]|nr:hypothetical protein [Saprospiraceae bacterium]MCB0545362.1 hypothetical protein [Saprospiraceae bacterium]MCB9307327.1 hypothetical protein [Lewinellaceae bacterium]MCB9354659.1 hypothetical protein [Lewinellaceae bacterium]